MRYLYPRLAAFGVALSALFTSGRAAEPIRPNIIFIMADDLGYGDLGSYGQTKIPTPHLDQLAAEGLRFTQAYAGSTVCAPSRNVLMTGRHTGHIEVRGNLKVGLRSSDETVASVLKSAGYATGIVGKWGLGYEGTDAVPTQKGFDFFFGYLDQTHAHNSYPSFLYRNEERITLPNVVPDEGKYGQGVATVRRTHSEDLFMTEAMGFIERHRDAPFYLYLPVTLPHANNEAGDDGMEAPPDSPRDFIDPSWPKPERDFAATVARLDADVGRIMAQLDELGIADHTLLVFTSDNGPHAEGGHDPAFFNSGGGLRGVKRDLYEGGVRIPLIARWPGQIAPATTTPQVTSFADFLPTFAALAGAPSSAIPAHDGIDLTDALHGHASSRDDAHTLYWEFYEGTSAQAIRFENWKAVRIPMFTGPIELYDLTNDVAETHDLAADHPAEVARADRLMAAAHVPNPLWKAPN